MDDTARPSLRLAIERTLNDPSYSRLASFISNVVLVAIIVSTSSFVVTTREPRNTSGMSTGGGIIHTSTSSGAHRLLCSMPQKSMLHSAEV